MKQPLNSRARTQQGIATRRKPLVAAISAAVLIGALSGQVAAQAFPAVLPLSALDGNIGFKIDGEATDDYAGRWVSAAGDVNGDGIDDLIIGAWHAGPNGFRSGRSYVVFGRDTGFPATLPLSDLDGSNGFKIDGEAADDYSGFSVSAAGDVNGDGLDDVIVGADAADPNGSLSGRSYVVFGRNTPFPATLQLSALDGSTGFKLNGETEDDFSGRSVDAAGDVNGDGIDDLIVGAWGADPNGSFSGRSYVVFGRGTGFPATLQLSALDGSTGFKLDGEAEYDNSGFSVSPAGDVNGDGIDDLIVGAYAADPHGPYSGRSYVVFGRHTGFPATLPLSALDGSNGFKLDGAAENDYSGFSVSTAGDVNGDGIDDLIIGALGAEPEGTNSGRSYVVFGRDTGFPATLQLSALDGSTGFKLDGEEALDFSGSAVGAAGDVNNDGIDDVIVGAGGANSYTGRSYVVFGRAPDLIFANGFESH